MECSRKLLPILRQGVEVVKMIWFKELKGLLLRRFAEREPAYGAKLAGAMVNELFGTPNQEPVFVAFVAENRLLIEGLWPVVAGELAPLLIPLTDALRIQVLCDHQEGIDSAALLLQAQAHGVLLGERELALPHSFIDLVRKLGGFHGMLIPPAPPANMLQ